jgi:hypothetical protein
LGGPDLWGNRGEIGAVLSGGEQQLQYPSLREAHAKAALTINGRPLRLIPNGEQAAAPCHRLDCSARGAYASNAPIISTTSALGHPISHAIKAVKWLGKTRKYMTTANGATMSTQSRMKILIGWGQRELSQ